MDFVGLEELKTKYYDSNSPQSHQKLQNTIVQLTRKNRYERVAETN